MSRKPYECFKCRDNGFSNTLVYLAGKDDQGKTIQLEENGSRHVHKEKQQRHQDPQQQFQQQSQSRGSTTSSLEVINAKLDRIISLLESRQRD